jgi:hypothetical protein
MPMKLRDYRLLFIIVGLIGILLIASPIWLNAVQLSPGERFSELYLLNADGVAGNYPFNIIVNQNYAVNIGVGNHLGSLAYYLVYVKLLNETDPLPNSNTSLPTPVTPLYVCRFFIPSSQTREGLIAFSVNGASITKSQSVVNQMVINGNIIEVQKPANWNTNSTMYHYRLLFELWLFNEKSCSFEYSNRAVYLSLNITSTLYANK